MSDSRFNFGYLLAELSRRKVIRVAVVYGFVGFAVIEAADIIAGALGLPPSFLLFVIVTVFLGFPLAIVLAWAYDIVPDATARRAQEKLPEDQYDDRARGLSPTIVLITAALAVIVTATWYEFREIQSTTEIAYTDPIYIDSVAVLPLDNLTGDSNHDHLGIGITEEIITHLAKIPPLKVISRHSVQAASAQNLTIPQIATVLGVRHIIEGSVKIIDGNSIRVTLVHINAETDAHLWAENLDGSLNNPVQTQEVIARFVTTKIVDLIPGLPLPNVTTHVDLGPGQKAYLQGKQYLSQRTSEGLNNAIYQFEMALELEPDYPPVYAALASAYSLALFYRYDIDLDGYTAAARALAMANKAIALDRNLPDGYTARGLLGFNIGHAPNLIAADFDQARRLSPNSARNPSWRSLVQAQLGNTDVAFAEAARAVELDPLSPARQIAMATVAFEAERYEQAIAASRIATAHEPRIIYGRAIEARSQILSGQPQQCTDMLLRPYRALRAICLAAADRREEADLLVNQILSEIENGEIRVTGYTEVITYEDLATYYAFIGDASRSLEFIRKSFDSSPAGIEFRLLDSGLFDRVRNNHEFNSAVATIKAGLFQKVESLSRDL